MRLKKNVWKLFFFSLKVSLPFNLLTKNQCRKIPKILSFCIENWFLNTSDFFRQSKSKLNFITVLTIFNREPEQTRLNSNDWLLHRVFLRSFASEVTPVASYRSVPNIMQLKMNYTIVVAQLWTIITKKFQ